MPTNTDENWYRTPDNMLLNICNGSEHCNYKPTMNNQIPEPSTCQYAWNQYSAVLLQAFTSANHNVWFNRNAGSCFHPERSLRSLDSDCAACKTQEQRELDHDRIAKLGNKKGFQDAFIVNQPYQKGQPAGPLWRPIDHQVAEVNLGPQRSWYFPNRSNLIIIATPNTLAKLTLQYNLPDPALRPTGCKEWSQRNTDTTNKEQTSGWMPYHDGMTLTLPENELAKYNKLDEQEFDPVVTANKTCELRIHCQGKGKIELHVIQHNVLVCAQCAAGEEGLSLWEVRHHLENREYRDSIHQAKSTGHRCWARHKGEDEDEDEDDDDE